MLPISSHIRKLIVSFVVVTLVLLVSVWKGPADNALPISVAAPLQAADIVWNPDNEDLDVEPGARNQRVEAVLKNNGTVTETITVRIDESQLPGGWTVEVSPSDGSAFSLAPSAEETFVIFVSAPDSPDPSTTFDFFVITEDSTGAQKPFTLNVGIVTTPTATPTSTETPTDTPTPSDTPTPTPDAIDLFVNDGKHFKDGTPATRVEYKLTIRNPSSSKGKFRVKIEKSCGDEVPDCNEDVSRTIFDLDENDSRDFSVYVIIPSSAEAGKEGKTTIIAELDNNPGDTLASVDLTTTVLEATLTPTKTPTETPTPGRICIDYYENDNALGSANVIDVNVPQPKPESQRTKDDPDDRRAICPAGDEDWLKFGGVAGKVYTIDITEMAQGIDLSLELFDEDGNSLAFNDDFFNRDPANHDPNDIRPRIESWRAPVDAPYFIRVRDSAERGDWDRTYTIIVQTESYGPTPAPVGQVCKDMFEPDGLPEQAGLIVYNEIQRNRSLCPTGDADWVKFFAKAGKRYYLYTDTGPYGQKDINDSQSGADTILVLTDRDGVSILDFNDDIPGGDTLDSEIEFVPEVDGFYYAQIKNIGDIGNQFIRYDLVLGVCVGEDACGRSISTVAYASNTSNDSAAFDSGPTPTIPTEEFSLDATETPESEPPDATAVPVASNRNSANAPTDTDDEEAALAFSQALGFADQSFWRAWRRNDLPVADGRVVRDWLWGPAPLIERHETFKQSPGGSRQVQYFDKGRMEINNPDGDRSSPWFMTFGLLVQDLVNSRIQVGEAEFISHQPATIPIIGDKDDASAPTYASFRYVLDTPAPDLTGERVLDSLDADGQVGLYEGEQYPETQLVYFCPETSHNIPAVFWEFLNAQGEVFASNEYVIDRLIDWPYILGYPMSEPYWVRAHIDGVAQDVLVQIFQRRVLAFTPENPPGQHVEMLNVGRHYYQWRYGEPLP